MSKPSFVIVLAEDQRQRQLIYRYLRTAGVLPAQIRFHISPSGRGSAEQWVRENFVVQVRTCRARHAQTSLFILLDADTNHVQDRLDVLDKALVSARQNPIDRKRDSIARLIFKRNVETWILFLALEETVNPPIDEKIDYKQTKNAEEWSDLVPFAARTLFAWTKQSVAPPANLIDSLQRGIEEISRAIPMV
jgi:hypothetical protein